jgi:anionic cell wall polymer biosynthesis LytR-Cps2A-Psr (LCP) family protein
MDDYIIFDFDAVRDLCKTLGGIEVKMNPSEARVMNRAFPDDHFAFGKNKLDGDQTLMYCRIRKGCGNDFERTRRQRDVLKILFSRIPSLGQDGILKLIGDKSSLIETSIKAQDLIAWGILLYQMRDAEIFDLRIPIDGAYKNKMIRGAAILLPNLAKNAKALQKFLDVEIGTIDQQTTLHAGSSGEGVRSLQDKLIQLGFLSGNASGTYDQPTVGAVKQYQRANGLSADGIAGPETLGFLYGTWF